MEAVIGTYCVSRDFGSGTLCASAVVLGDLSAWILLRFGGEDAIEDWFFAEGACR